MKKRVLPILLAVCMTFTSVEMNAQAYVQDSADQKHQEEIVEPEVEQEEGQGEETGAVSEPEVEQDKEQEEVVSEPEVEQDKEQEEVVSEPEAEQGKEKTEGTIPEPEREHKEDTKEPELQSGTEKKETTDTQKEKRTETVKQKTVQKTSEEKALLNYILMEKANMEVPDTQNVVASLGKEGAAIANARLIYRNETTGEELAAEAAQIVEDMVLFTMDFTEASQAGSYLLKSIAYTENGVGKEVQLSNLDMNVAFGVNTKVEVKPDEVLFNEEALKEVEANVVTLNEDGEAVSENTIKNVLGNTEAALPAEASGAVARNIKGTSKNLVVVLDPGHDDTHAGAQYYGAGEEDLVLKIAKYCQDELKKYSGISVYMVRESGTCPFGGSAVTAGTCNEGRVNFAAGKKADVYVSFHLNASASSVPQGVGVYYPNGSYRPDLGQEGKELGTEIYKKLSELGLSTWAGGTLIRNSEDDTTYPDGSLADYLGVIRRSKLAGFPAVLIEHAFLSSVSDYMNFLSSDAKLKKLGVADANAIVSYYGLKKKSSKPAISYVQSVRSGQLKIAWKEMAGAESYQVYRSTQENKGFSRIATVEGASYTDKTVKVGTYYYYKIKVIFSDSQAQTSEVKKGISVGQSAVSYVKSEKNKTLKVGWKKVAGAKGYRIYRSTRPIGNYQKIMTVPSGSTTSYIDKVPKNNTRYYYKVQPYNVVNGREGVGAVSAPKYGFVLNQPDIKFTVARSDKSIEINWKSVNRAEGYIVVRSTAKDRGYKKIGVIKSGKTLSYHDTSAKPGKTYYYRVRAISSLYGQDGSSGYSNTVSGRTVSKTSFTSISSKNSSAIDLKWKKIAGAYGYKIQRSETRAGGYKPIVTIKSGNTVTFKDREISAEKVYYYKITVLNRVNGKTGSSGYSNAAMGRAAVKTSITHARSINSSGVELTWKKVNGVYGYRVKRSTSREGTYSLIATVKGKDCVSYRDKNLKSGKTYYYAVETIVKTDKLTSYSGNSKVVSARSLPVSQISSAKAASGQKITLKWNQVSGVTGYDIRRSDKENGKYIQVGYAAGKNTTSFTDDTAKEGETYYYKIRGCVKKKGKSTGLASYSKACKAWTPGAVEIIRVSSNSSNRINLRWNAVSNANGYIVQRSTQESGGFKTIDLVTSKHTVTYADETVEKGETYYYRIAARNKIGGAAGRGNYSSVKQVNTMSVPTINNIKYTEAKVLELAWKAVNHAAGYQIQRKSGSAGDYKTIATVSDTSYTDGTADISNEYYYRIRSYGNLPDGTKVYSTWSSSKKGMAAYAIMGESNVSVSDMVKYYNAKYRYPASFYTTKGAANIQSFCTILKQEAEDEGIRAEVLFAQVILETGGLQYKGDVRMEQCNFGGLGATGNGVTGETFPNVRIGLRAQVQHLKAYASTQALKKACVDTRFKYVKRGSAPYVEWLPIPKNPYGTGWAADPDYDVKLLKIIQDII